MRKTKNNRPLVYREADASMVGAQEPVWPDSQTQQGWSQAERQRQLGRAFRWYNLTQDQRQSTEFIATWLEGQRNHQALAGMARKWGHLNTVWGWLARCESQGLRLRISEVRKIHAALTDMVMRMAEAQRGRTPQADPAAPRVTQPLVERTPTTLQQAQAEIQVSLDDFVQNGFQGQPGVLATLMRLKITPAQVPAVQARLQRLRTELQELIDEKTPDLVEAWGQFSRREHRALLAWLDLALQQTQSLVTVQTAARKPRSRRASNPTKLVSKFQYLHASQEFQATSVDPVEILRAREVWLYDTARRRLQRIQVDDTQTALYVRGNKILGHSESQSAWKILRNPQKDLPAFLALNKAAARKWFDDLRGQAHPATCRGSEQTLILRANR